MKALAAKLIGAATATVVAAGCAAGPHLLVEEREVLVRPDPEHDAVQVLVLERGVTAGGLRLDPSLEYVDRLLAGDAFLPSGLEILDPGKLDAHLDATVDGTVLYLDDDDRLCLAQWSRIERVSGTLSRTNEEVRASLLQGIPADPPSQESAWSIVLRRAAEAGWVFYRFEGPRFIIDLPCDDSVPAVETVVVNDGSPGSWSPGSDVEAHRSEDRVSVIYGRPESPVWHLRSGHLRLAPVEWIPIWKEDVLTFERQEGVRWHELDLWEELGYVLLTTCSPDEYDGRLYAALRKTQHPVHTDLATAGLRTAFLAGDPALPLTPSARP